ncbi:MAG: YdcF family protein [Flavobacteriales bacterium]|jgi:uncharacterized SAM-binding protein YcdF (DUF218 family)|nr:MAG: YdcF family protein [Flavobacteriales bacterium]
MKRWREAITTAGMLLGLLSHSLHPWFSRLVLASGSLLLLGIALAFTRIPYDAHRWLGEAAGTCASEPSTIVVLGGSGMPSGPELLRLQHAAMLSNTWPSARLLVIHPGNGEVLRAMREELLVRGVLSTRIDTLNQGENTRDQALAASRLAQGPVAVVTAPENMYRSIRAFRKAGITGACGAPAWDHAMAHDFDYGHTQIGGKPWVPDVSGHPRLRYTFWNYLKLEVTCLREGLAIAYYRLNGWI